MIILGLILLLLGLFVAKALFWIGVVLLVVGLVLNFGPVGDSTTRRRYW